MAKAKAQQDDTSDQDAQAHSAAQTPPEGGGGSDPGLGVAADETPRGKMCIQLSGGWTEPVTGVEHVAGEWVVLDEQTANDLNTAGYAVRNPDGTPRTAKQAAQEEAAKREAAKGGGEERGRGDGDEGEKGRAKDDEGEKGDSGKDERGKRHTGRGHSKAHQGSEDGERAE